MYKFAIIFCLFSFSSFAQSLPKDMDTPRERADRMTQEMIQQLDLHANQIDAIDHLNFEYALIMQNQIFDSNSNMWSKYYKGNSIMGEKDKILKKMLTTKQYQSYEVMKSDILWQIMQKIF